MLFDVTRKQGLAILTVWTKYINVTIKKNYIKNSEISSFLFHPSNMHHSAAKIRVTHIDKLDAFTCNLSQILLVGMKKFFSSFFQEFWSNVYPNKTLNEHFCSIPRNQDVPSVTVALRLLKYIYDSTILRAASCTIFCTETTCRYNSLYWYWIFQ